MVYFSVLRNVPFIRRNSIFKVRKACATPSLAIRCRRWASSSSGRDSKSQAMERQVQNQAAETSDEKQRTTEHKVKVPPKKLSSMKSFSALSDPVSDSSLEIGAPKHPLKIELNQDLALGRSTRWETDRTPLSFTMPSTELELNFEKEAMFDPAIHLPYAPQDWKGYEPATSLSDFLMKRIGVSGPITTAEFMRHALTHPLFGYYTNPPKSALAKSLDQDETMWDELPVEDKTTGVSASDSKNDSTLIGPKGDFITAPEVSHVFGHCICVWLVTQWEALGKPSEIQLLELGGGRGTLMVDILQLATSSKLIDFGRSVCAVHIVEASHELRSQQKESLEQALGHIIDFQFVEQSLSNANDQDAGGAESKQHDSQQEERSSSNGPIAKIPIRVEWHEDFGSFQHRRNKDVPVMMFLQEFLDALPVHVFERTTSGWRERLIDVASAEDKPANTQESLVPRLRQVMSPEVTPAVNLFLESNNAYDNVPLGSVVEVCPEALLLVQDMAKVLEESQGVSLIIDYGQEGTSDTLRAFSNHLQVPLTSYPGQVDVTADVDFYALKACLGNSEISAFGPVTQGEFLMRMGAGDMVIHAIEQPEATPEHAKRLSDALKYLVLPEHMGERYKVLALGRKRDGIFGPPGMERSIK